MIVGLFLLCIWSFLTPMRTSGPSTSLAFNLQGNFRFRVSKRAQLHAKTSLFKPLVGTNTGPRESRDIQRRISTINDLFGNDGGRLATLAGGGGWKLVDCHGDGGGGGGGGGGQGHENDIFLGVPRIRLLSINEHDTLIIGEGRQEKGTCQGMVKGTCQGMVVRKLSQFAPVRFVSDLGSQVPPCPLSLSLSLTHIYTPLACCTLPLSRARSPSNHMQTGKDMPHTHTQTQTHTHTHHALNVSSYVINILIHTHTHTHARTHARVCEWTPCRCRVLLG